MVAAVAAAAATSLAVVEGLLVMVADTRAAPPPAQWEAPLRQAWGGHLAPLLAVVTGQLSGATAVHSLHQHGAQAHRTKGLPHQHGDQAYPGRPCGCICC